MFFSVLLLHSGLSREAGRWHKLWMVITKEPHEYFLGENSNLWSLGGSSVRFWTLVVEILKEVLK